MSRRKGKQRVTVDSNSRFTESETLYVIKKNIAMENRINQLNRQIEQLGIAINKANMMVVPIGDNKLSLIPAQIPKSLDSSKKIKGKSNE